MKKRTLIFALAATVSLATLENVFGQPPRRGGGARESARSIEYRAATTFEQDATVENGSFASETSEEVAILAKGGTVKLTSPTIRKSGAPSGRSDNFDFYGVNAAALATNDGNLVIEGGTVETTSSYSSGLFACGSGKIVAKDVAIKTSANNSGAVMVTNGGTLTATNVVAETSGGSSAPIRSDRGGGVLTVEGGKYRSSGAGSPAIYSTAEIVVNDAELESTCSEGAIVEGRNSIALNRVKLVDDNTTLHGKSTTRKNVFLYQSFSGDAAVGKARFEANDCEIETKKGDSFYSTNTTCSITLRRNKIVNSDPDGWFLRAQREGWGRKGANGANVELNLIEQDVEGNVYVDNISTLKMTISEGSKFVGALNAANTAERVDVILDAKSTFELTDDCWVSSLTNEDSTGANIKLNGHKLNVGVEERVDDGLPDLTGNDFGFGPPPGEPGENGSGGFGRRANVGGAADDRRPEPQGRERGSRGDRPRRRPR